MRCEGGCCVAGMEGSKQRGGREQTTRRKGANNADETLVQALPGLEVSAPVSHGLLHVFPLRMSTHAEQDISLLEDGLRAGTLHMRSCARLRPQPHTNNSRRLA